MTRTFWHILRQAGRRLARRPLLASLLVLGWAAIGMDRPVAPLDSPVLCLFWRVRDTFDLVVGDPRNQQTRLAAEFLRQATQAWRDWRGAGRPGVASGPVSSLVEDPAGWLRELATVRDFVPEDVSFYLRSRQEFALVLTGTIDPARWRDLFPAAQVLPRDQGFAILLPDGSGRGHLALHVRPGVIFLTPAELEGNLVDALRLGTSGLTERFKTFRAMVQRRPLVAVEADLQAVAGILATGRSEALRLGPPLSSVATFRLLMDPQLIKLQLHTPDDTQRAALLSLTEGVAGTVREAIASLSPALPGGGPTGAALQKFADSIWVEAKGQSVFLEAGGLGAAHPLAGLSGLALVSSIAAASHERFLRHPRAAD
ncbi:MAG: hypothetical protein OZSIB_4122 [Candidatus Ozemobacter sibiricus]|jgi:hypothetical protein|uniref:DUF3352 domain-containing protein n=1 Tax=Candidatus Ozemobacter sibiricus TaxID=2268124 RepID=A0A367ZNM8_9BACT|nr:MAG: hypothetical protein OZSIB_4122 [Candidatus Ozemobacter sibiricus]